MAMNILCRNCKAIL